MGAANKCACNALNESGINLYGDLTRPADETQRVLVVHVPDRVQAREEAPEQGGFA